MKRLVFLPILLLVVNFCYSQSVLWKVTGNKIKGTSYLYGTIHITDKRVFMFDSTVTDAFDSCDAFAMEILMDEIDPKSMQEATLMKDGMTLKQLLSPEDYHLLDSAFQAATGARLILYNRMKPFFVSSAMMQSGISKEMEQALDLYFLNKARAAGKQCFGVEQFIDQINAIDAISLEDQINMLMESLRDTAAKSDMEQFDELLDAYLTFNLEEAMKMASDPSLPAEFNEAFLIGRNVGMAKNFLKIAKKWSVFCAIGAAHLPGELGVISHLRKAGLTVEPVVFKWNE
ncbi:MAG: TraB/GumN family protein [Bacteroidales bacterium]|nr:TraB/GumN family protein [Bacteroidales bacterium]